MIRRVCLERFRALDHKCVSLEGQTLIYGPPNSGKTTIMEAVALLMQSRGEHWLVLEGPHLIIHEPEDLHYGGNLEIPFTIELGVKLGIGDVDYGYRYAAGTGYVEQWVGLNGELLARVKKDGDESLITYPLRAKLCATPYAVMNEDLLITCEPVSDEKVKLAERVLLELRLGLKDRFYFISGRRLAAWKYTYETHVDLMPETGIGAEGQFIAHHLSRILAHPTFENVRNALYEYLKLAGIEDIRVGLVRSGRIAVYVKTGGLWANIYNAGNYTKAVLPVLLQILLANPDSIVFVDDIDLAVPTYRAEDLLSAIVGAARKRGLQVVMAAKEEGFVRAAERLGVNVVTL